MENPADTLLGTEPTKTVEINERKPANEKRTERLGLLVTPSTAQDIKLVAQLEGTSFNAIANDLLEKYIKSYIKKNGDKLEQAKQLLS